MQERSERFSAPLLALPIANETYQGIRLTYSYGFESAFIDIGSFQPAARRIGRAFVVALASAALISPVWFVFFLLTTFADESFGAILLLVNFVPFAVFIFLLVRRTSEDIASWGVLADGMAHESDRLTDLALAELRRVRRIERSSC